MTRTCWYVGSIAAIITTAASCKSEDAPRAKAPAAPPKQAAPNKAGKATHIQSKPTAAALKVPPPLPAMKHQLSHIVGSVSFLGWTKGATTKALNKPGWLHLVVVLGAAG